jgi:16S rRNA processing protein RimM
VEGTDMQLVVARIGRAHSLRGEVALDVRTDDPEGRLAVGTVLTTDPASAGPLTVLSRRLHQGRWLVKFAEVADRSAAEALRGVELVVEASNSDEEDAWYPHELRGLRAELVDGTVVGEVVALEHLPAHDALLVKEPGGERTLVPFVTAIVPVVDVAGGRVVLDPPGGLLASDAARLVVAGPSSDADDGDATDGADGADATGADGADATGADGADTTGTDGTGR